MMLIERVFRWNGSFYTSNVNFTLHTCTWWQRMICKIVRKLWNYKSSDFKKHSLKFFAATYISEKLNSMELLHCQIFLRNKVEKNSILLNNLISVNANKTLWFFFLLFNQSLILELTLLFPTQRFIDRFFQFSEARQSHHSPNGKCPRPHISILLLKHFLELMRENKDNRQRRPNTSHEAIKSLLNGFNNITREMLRVKR